MACRELSFLELIPIELLGKMVPWHDNRSVNALRMVCRRWRDAIDSLLALKDTFFGSLNQEVWDTTRLNLEVFKFKPPMKGFMRRKTTSLSKFNQWSFLSTKRRFPKGTVISYMIRFPSSSGYETKFTVTGDAILRRTRHHDFKWVRWERKTETFHDIHPSSIKPSQKKWYSIGHEIVADGVVTYEDGQRLFKLSCDVPPEGLTMDIHLQHLIVGTPVTMDIGRVFIYKTV